MPAMLLSFITSKAGIVGMIAIALLAVFGIQDLRLRAAQHGEQSAQAAAKASETGWASCRATLTAQNTALAAQSARSSAALASAGKQVSAVTPQAAHITAQAEALRSYRIKGGDRCARWEDVETEVRAAFQ